MSDISKALYLLALMSLPVMADRALPVAPVNASMVAAAGLQRLDTTELKKAFSGKRSEQNVRGKSYRAEYGLDGSVVLDDTSGLMDRGTFSITDKAAAVFVCDWSSR